MPGGRPRKYNSPEEMAKGISQYFVKCVEDDCPPSVCGLALHLGFVSRNSLLSYEGYDEKYFGIIKRAKTQIEQFHEENLTHGKSAAGHIFWLKNYGWTDDSNVNVTGNVGAVFTAAEKKLGEKMCKQFAKEYDDSDT